jgi:hypothetical protein
MDRRFQKRITHYLAQQERKGIEALAKLDMTGWFDFWHTHIDWKSKANRAKPMVAKITYSLLQQAEALAEKRHDSIQVWATLCEDTGNNAVYFHSLNPNGTAYPYSFDGVEWGISEPPEAENLLNSTHEIGRCQYTNEVVYIIRKRA